MHLQGKPSSDGRELYLGDFLGISITIVYHIALNYPVMGERLLERLVFLACLLKL